MEPAVTMALGRETFPFLHHGTTLETRGFKQGFKARPKTAPQALAGPHSGRKRPPCSLTTPCRQPGIGKQFCE